MGDAIVSVNEASIETATHDEAVATLKNAGDQVMLDRILGTRSQI